MCDSRGAFSCPHDSFRPILFRTGPNEYYDGHPPRPLITYNSPCAPPAGLPKIVLFSLLWPSKPSRGSELVLQVAHEASGLECFACIPQQGAMLLPLTLRHRSAAHWSEVTRCALPSDQDWHRCGCREHNGLTSHAAAASSWSILVHFLHAQLANSVASAGILKRA